MNNKKWGERLSKRFLQSTGDKDSPLHYQTLRRNITILMLLVTIIPLIFMAVINYLEYKSNLKSEIINPISILTNKTVHSIELYMEERLSTIRSIASFYSFEDLSDEKTLSRIYRVLKKEFTGFVDLGIIDENGMQISYSGPYELLNKDYLQQIWFQEVSIKGSYISDVFLGYRQFPHIAIAVQQFEPDGHAWILRATIDTDKLDNIIAAMGLDPESDAFLVSGEGILQTHSKFCGNVLEHCKLNIPMGSYRSQLIEEKNILGKDVLIAIKHFAKQDFALVVVKPKSVILKSWYALQGEMLLIFIISISIIIVVVLKVSNMLVKKIREADERRELAFRELEHSQKLSSIGRLAAGVAHEINNPMAIINEKAGLIKDLYQNTSDSEKTIKLIKIADSIIGAVGRCRNITHRLLGFAKRFDIELEMLSLNDVIIEVMGFLDKEALFRKIDIQLDIDEDLPRIFSDKGQIQQVFLNILSNSMSAVKDGGKIIIRSWDEDVSRVGASIKDNGCGMSKETLAHIFEPFFTTKKEYGTGLGLPITYGIVKKLGGDLIVKSNENEGTDFTIYFLKKSKTE
ncbi:MAG: two-component sensor histidine kinase [Deltaproteobacteria bacterium]|nr:two-component sensor histidine kinase [Deltaproteobacteria bacterium]